MKRYRVIHVSYGGFGSAFASQTLGLAGALERAGVPMGLLVFARAKEIAEVGAVWDGESRGLSGSLSVLPCPPFVGKVNLRLARQQSAALIRNAAAGGRDVILHCRGQFSSCLGLLLRDSHPGLSLRVIADFRGNVVEEMKVQSGQGPYLRPLKEVVSPALTKWRVRVSRSLEAEVVKRADGFSFVSEAFRQEIQRTYRTPLRASVVVPTCTSLKAIGAGERDSLRESAKAKLCVQGKYVVVYNGSLLPWQEPADILRAYRACRQARPDAHLLVVTTSPAEARSYLAEAGLPAAQWTVVSVPHAEVQNYLVAGDVGLLLRRPSPINSVASPIKFAEYVGSGVPVLASPGIGDLDQIISTYGVGRILDAPERAGEALADLTFSFEGAHRVLREYYSWTSGVSKLLALYERVGVRCQKESAKS